MKSALPDCGSVRRGIGASVRACCLGASLWIGCGGTPSPPSASLADSAAAIEGSAQAVDLQSAPLRSWALPYRVEAWPQLAEGDPEQLRRTDHGALAFASVPEAGFPWTVVLELLQGPHELGAFAVYHDGDPRQIADFGLMILAGPLVLGRETFPRLLESAQRVGEGVVGLEPGWYVYTLPEPVVATFVIVRARSNQGGTGTGLGPTVLLAASDTAAFVGRSSEVRIQTLTPSPRRTELAEWWPGQMPSPGSEEGSTAPQTLTLPASHTDAFGPNP